MISSNIVKNFFNNFDIIKYPLFVGILLSITAAILGVVLVLKRYSMIGDGLSHVSFGVYAIAIGDRKSTRLNSSHSRISYCGVWL